MGDTTTVAVPCSYPNCSRSTKNPSGMCFQHEDKALPDEHEAIDRAVAVPKINTKYEHSDDDTILPNGMRERPEQTDCRRRIMEEFDNSDRCQLRMACGMGKTIVQQKVLKDVNEQVVDEEERQGLFLVTAPSISLAKQLRADYEDKGILQVEDQNGNTITPRMLSVHQDSQDFKGMTGAEASQKQSEAVKKFLNESGDSDSPSVVFAVTSDDSLGKIIEQQRAEDKQFDCSVFDESHNLTRTEEGLATQGYPRVFFNEDDKGIDSRRRLFASASQKGSESSRSRLGSDTKEHFLKLTKKLDDGGKLGKGEKMDVLQDNPDAFGRVIGDEYTYRYAVEHGHLVPPRVVATQVMVAVDPNDVPHRDKTFVSYDGTSRPATGKRPGPEPGEVTLGEYTSMSSSLDSLTDEGSLERGVPRNVLSFTDTVEEARNTSNPEKWRGVAFGKAALYSGNVNSEEDANHVLDNRETSDPNDVKAAMLYKSGIHSKMTYSESKLPEKQRERAENWFPKGYAYNSDDCTCGRHGGYCACHRIVSNVDMFSEGIDIPSVDTVVMNRSNRTTEANVFQAVGRSSRKWSAPVVENGQEVGTHVKNEGRVIVPETYCGGADDDDDWKQSDANLSSKTIRQLNRVWRDRGNQPWRQNLSDDIKVEADDGEGYDADAFVRARIEQLDGTQGETDEQMRERMTANYRVYETLKKEAGKEYQKNNPNKKFSQLSPRVQYEEIKRQVYAGDPSTKGIISSIKSYYRHEGGEFPTHNQFQAAREYYRYISDMREIGGDAALYEGEAPHVYESASKVLGRFFKSRRKKK